MTKKEILQKHFTAEFGHDGHGEFMQYILDAMEEYAQQEVKKLSRPDVVEKGEQLRCPQCGGEDVRSHSEGKICGNCNYVAGEF